MHHLVTVLILCKHVRTSHGEHGDKAEEMQASAKSEQEMSSDTTYHNPKT